MSHGRVRTSTDKGKARHCDITPDLFEGKATDAEVLKSLHTVAIICEDDFFQRLQHYDGRVVSEYDLASDRHAYTRTKRVYSTLATTLAQAEARGTVDPWTLAELRAVRDRLRTRLRTLAQITAIEPVAFKL